MTESLEERLRQMVSEIPVFDLGGCKPSERTWREHANRLREEILEKDPRQFLEFWTVRHTMYTVWHPDWEQVYLSYLTALPDWKTRWYEAVREPEFGEGVARHEPHTGVQFLGHAYILAQFETRTGAKTDGLSTIFEFGGGYGSMARLVHNLSFTGQYLDYDLPVQAALADYYLDSTGPHSVTFFSNIGELAAILAEIDTDNALFLSMWGLSETPLELRSKVLELVRNFRYFLITYQSKFYEMDNRRFFVDWIARTDEVKWQTWDIENVGSYGLVGMRK